MCARFYRYPPRPYRTAGRVVPPYERSAGNAPVGRDDLGALVHRYPPCYRAGAHCAPLQGSCAAIPPAKYTKNPVKLLSICLLRFSAGYAMITMSKGSSSPKHSGRATVRTALSAPGTRGGLQLGLVRDFCRKAGVSFFRTRGGKTTPPLTVGYKQNGIFLRRRKHA